MNNNKNLQNISYEQQINLQFLIYNKQEHFTQVNNITLACNILIEYLTNSHMQYIKRRENDPQYLKSVIEQRQIMIQQEQRKYTYLLKLYESNQIKVVQLQSTLRTQQNGSQNEILNLNLAIRQQQTQLQAMKHDKSQYEFKINMLKMQIKQQQKDHKSQLQGLKIEYDSQKQTLQLKLSKMQKNLSSLSNHYNVQSQINNDKLKLIQDSNRDLRGFSNQKQQRMIMIQNQQYANEIQYQAKQIQNLLQKNQKIIEEIRTLKTQLQLHKQIQNDLVKRSSLAQKLIKQLNKKIRQLQSQSIIQASKTKIQQSQSVQPSQQSSRISKLSLNKQLQQELNKLKFEFANLKNHSLYLENMQKIYTSKYQTVGAIIAQYLENILFFKQKKQKQKQKNKQDYLESIKQINLDLNSLRKKDVKQWKTQELQTVLFLIINQIKPFLSKSSLINFPQNKNINISFTQAQNKQSVALPKIAQNYQKTYQKQASKLNRFKDIPLDISTKILRSHLRQWGTKVSYGSNIPSLARVRKLKSKSIAGDIDRSGFI